MEPKAFLSILIPVYNWDISQLLYSLDRQRAKLATPEEIEIVVVDDGSNQKFSNRHVAEGVTGVRYSEQSENTGRSAVRNALIDLARGVYVVFLDADMLPDQDTFLETYVELAKKDIDVACGGISYQQVGEIEDPYTFYVYKSSRTEALPAEIRKQTPWRYVFTSNILLRREIVASVRFDSRFVSYGFEDIEWGIRLSKSYELTHVDNTCSHLGIMVKEQVFAKMRESIDNHYLLFSLYPEIGETGAISPATYLQYLPDSLLLMFDNLFTYLFRHTSWHPLLFIVFQADKSLLLARKLKGNKAA